MPRIPEAVHGQEDQPQAGSRMTSQCQGGHVPLSACRRHPGGPERVRSMMTMVARKVVVCRCGMLVFAIEYLSCFSVTSSAGTTAAQWTLYSGLKLSWNEASMFCKSLGGHLPVVNTKLKWNSFNATVVNWYKANLSVDDVWTGLFLQSPSAVPNSWEADCSLQPDGLNFWGPSEPDKLHTEFCVRYSLVSKGLHTTFCSYLSNIVCEFDQGSCRSTTGSLLQTLSHTTLSKVTTEASCWSECLNYPPTGSGQECVGVTFSLLGLLGGTCTAYLADILQSTSSSSLSLTLLDTTMVKECFQTNTTDFCSNYTFVDNSNTPLPAGDPCNSNTASFVPDVLISINSTCIHTSAASSSQTSTSGKNLAQTTKQQSSNVSQTGTTWPTTTTTSTPRNDIIDIWSTMPVNNSTYSIITSTVEVTNSTQVNNSTHSITSSTKPVATGSTSSTWGTVQGNDGLTTNRDISTQVDTSTSGQERTKGGLTLPPTDPVSDLTKYVSTSEKSPSTTGFQPLLCSCMVFLPNTSSRLENTIIHRNITSKYRRSLNSEWGSPSAYTSTSCATFVIVVVVVVGILFVASDINRCACLVHKKRRGTVERLSE